MYEIKKRGKSYQLVCTDISDVFMLEDENFGICIHCGEEHYNCEPDASGYHCEYCGKTAVYGLGSLSCMGLIDFKENLS